MPQLSNITGRDEMVKQEWTTMQAAIPRGLFVLLACAILGVAPRADASPFLLNLIASDSSDASGGSGGGQAGRLGLRGRHSDLSGPEFIYRGVGLSHVARPTIARLSSEPSSSLAVGLIAISKSSGRLAATSMADVGSVASAGLASVTQLNLGDGSQLSVSDSVGAALADALSSAAASPPVLTPPVLIPPDLTPPDVLTAIGGPPRSDDASRPDTPTVANASNESNNADASGNNHDAQRSPSSDYNPVSPLPGSTNNGLADENVKAILTEISSGIISLASEQTDRAAGDFGAAANLVQNPEPATLILLASALVLTANRLRRQRH